MTDLAKISSTGGNAELEQLLNILSSPAFGSGKTSSSESSSVSAGAGSDVEALLQSLKTGADPETMKNLVDGIYRQAKTAMGPNLMESLSSGSRVYNNTTLAQQQGDQIAKATQAAATAVLQAQQQSADTQAKLATAKLNASKVTTKTTSTGATPAGQLAQYGLAALQGQSLLKKMGVIKSPLGGVNDAVGDPTIGDSSAAAFNIGSPSGTGDIQMPGLSDAIEQGSTSDTLFAASAFFNDQGTAGNIFDPFTDVADNSASFVNDAGEAMDAVDASVNSIPDIASAASDTNDWADFFGGFFAEGGLIDFEDDPRAPKGYIGQAPKAAPDYARIATVPGKTGGTGIGKKNTTGEAGTGVGGETAGGMAIDPTGGTSTGGPTGSQVAAFLGFALNPGLMSLANLVTAGVTGKGITGNVLEKGKDLVSSLMTDKIDPTVSGGSLGMGGTSEDPATSDGSTTSVGGPTATGFQLDAGTGQQTGLSFAGVTAPDMGDAPDNGPASNTNSATADSLVGATGLTGNAALEYALGILGIDMSGNTTDTGAPGAPDAGGFSDIGGFGGIDPGGVEAAGAETGAEVGAESGAEPFVKGGKIQAPGDGTVDTKFIKVANKEYVLNAKAVEAIGVDKLDYLNNLFKEAA